MSNNENVFYSIVLVNSASFLFYFEGLKNVDKIQNWLCVKQLIQMFLNNFFLPINILFITHYFIFVLSFTFHFSLS